MTFCNKFKHAIVIQLVQLPNNVMILVANVNVNQMLLDVNVTNVHQEHMDSVQKDAKVQHFLKSTKSMCDNKYIFNTYSV